MLSLIFDKNFVFLGEIFTEEGVFSRSVLSVAGEESIGASLSVWQTQGISARREMTQMQEDGTREITFFCERVQLREKAFYATFKQWTSDHGMWMVELEGSHYGCWELLLQVPCESRERFAFLMALKYTPQDQLIEWRKTLEEVDQLVLEERRSLREGVKHMQQNLGHHLTKSFTKRHAAT